MSEGEETVNTAYDEDVGGGDEGGSSGSVSDEDTVDPALREPEPKPKSKSKSTQKSVPAAKSAAAPPAKSSVGTKSKSKSVPKSSGKKVLKSKSKPKSKSVKTSKVTSKKVTPKSKSRSKSRSKSAAAAATAPKRWKRKLTVHVRRKSATTADLYCGGARCNDQTKLKSVPPQQKKQGNCERCFRAMKAEERKAA